MLGFYIGGMGAKGQNYHTKLMARMGYEEEALPASRSLFFEGRRDEAIAAVPDEFADEISLVGPPGASRNGSRRGTRARSRPCSSTRPVRPRACARSPTSSRADPPRPAGRPLVPPTIARPLEP